MTIKEIASTVWKALKGENHDYTQEAIPKAVVLLAVPMILELSLESVFAIVDMFFVSKLGQSAVATVGLTESVVTIIYSVAIGLSAGAGAVVARRVGEKDADGAAHAGAQSIIMGIILGIVLGILGVIFAKDILILMGASDEVVREGTTFAQIMFGSCPIITLLFLINGIFRGAGDAAMAMKSLWIASGVNIILCPIFINMFGLKGAAIATLIGRSSGVLYQSLHLIKGDGVLKFKRAHYWFDNKVINSITQIAWPAGLQFIIGSGSWIVLTRLVAEVGGTAASAGYQIAFRNFVFFILPAFGMSNAAATLVGQNLGAKELGRAEESVIVTAKYSAFFTGFVTLFFLVLAGPIVRVFTNEPEVIAYGTDALRVMGAGFVFYGTAMVLIQSFNGAGDSKTPTWINFVCFWIIQIPCAYLLAKGLNMGPLGAVVMSPIAEFIIVIVSWYYFKQGKWKTIQV